jgi:Protein of unknown function (DUF1236)
MRNQRTTFLAGAAALALLAGTGFAAAQDSSMDHNGSPRFKEPHAAAQPTPKGNGGTAGAQSDKMHAHQGKMNATKGTDKKTGQNAQRGKMGETEGPAQKTDQNAKSAKMNGSQGAAQDAKGMERPGQSNRNAAHQPRRSKHAQEANRGSKSDKMSAAGRLRDLQGNAAPPRAARSSAGGNVSLTREQRTKIRDTVIAGHGAPRVGRVNFDVRVGTVIPRDRVHVVPVPDMLVQIEPEWRGLLYFVFRDEVVIVNPRDMRIVAVLEV